MSEGLKLCAQGFVSNISRLSATLATQILELLPDSYSVRICQVIHNSKILVDKIKPI